MNLRFAADETLWPSTIRSPIIYNQLLSHLRMGPLYYTFRVEHTAIKHRPEHQTVATTEVVESV
jgi:hypothetical protein